MNATEAQDYVGRSVRGRLIGGVDISGGCTDRRMYLVDAAGERVVNVTNLTPAELDEQSRRTTSNKGARHKTG